MRHGECKVKRTLLGLLWLGAILVNIKSIFADFGPDQTYALVTSYRHIKGDTMLLTMWEPHQTSAFIADIGLLLYRALVPSLEGVALFMQLYGVLLYAIVTYVLFRTLKKYIPEEIVHFICIFFFTYRAKLMVFPEFSNMHIAFCVLFFLFLIEYFNHQEEYKYLISAAISMCFLILSYPACIVNFIGALICFCLYAGNKRKSIAVFTGICVALGGAYVGYFAFKLGMHELNENIKLILLSDVSHVDTVFSPYTYFRGFIYGVVWVCILGLISFFLRRLCRNFYLAFFTGAIVTDLMMLFGLRQNALFMMEWIMVPYIMNAVVIIMGACSLKLLTKEERRMWTVSIILSACSALSVFLLTNQEFLSICLYMPLGTMISFLNIAKRIAVNERENCKNRLQEQIAKTDRGVFQHWVLAVLCLWIMLHRGLVVYGYINVEGKFLITNVENIVRVGPTKGIATSLAECNEARLGIEDWKNYTEEGEKAFIVDQAWYDPIAFLYHQNEVSAYSTIDTPTYDENIEVYWSKYEDKRPSVIAVKAWNNVEVRDNTGWFADYLEENYELYGKGTFWHFYRPKGK